MKPGKKLLWGLGLLLLFAVTAAAKITTNYDRSADYSTYETFSWLSQPGMDPSVKDQVSGFINDQLKNKNLKPVDTGGDITVAAHVATGEAGSLEKFYDGVSWHWQAGFGREKAAETFPAGTLVVDVFDSARQQVIWRGVATDALAGQLQKSIENMFKQFPPKISPCSDACYKEAAQIYKHYHKN